MHPAGLLRTVRPCLAALLMGATFPALSAAQAAPSDPAPSSMIKSTINRTDPIRLLLDRKKQLALTKAQEDTLKSWGKEMRHMQDLVYEDIDKTAKKERDSEKPGDAARARSGAVSDAVQERIRRLQDIQAAYRDRAHGILDASQRTMADSLDVTRRNKG